MPHLNWLHLSDWHQQGKDFDRVVVRDALIKDLRNRKAIDPGLADVAFVVFSGDLACYGQPQDYEAAREQLLDPILNALDLEPDRLFLVPGNHDMSRDHVYTMLPPALQKPFEDDAAVNQWLVDEERRTRAFEPFKAYRAFVTAYTGQDSPDYASIRKFTAAGRKVALLGLNSAWMCARHTNGKGEVDDARHLVVGEPQVHAALAEIADADLRIAVLHHPLDWLADFDRHRIESRLGRECHFILRGHEHQPQVQVMNGTGGQCVIIPAGASYDRRIATSPRYTNAYNWVSLDGTNSQGRVYLRRWSESRNAWIEDTDAYPGGQFPLPSLPKTPVAQATPQPPVTAWDIFISYARKDRDRVAPIARALESLGYAVWWDADLRAGRRFDEEIEQALAAARCVLVVWTEAAVRSHWVRAEATEALDAGKLVPVFLEAVKPPLYFRQVHGVDLSGWDGRPGHGEFPRLLRDCAALLSPADPRSRPEPPKPTAPTPAPVPFTAFRDRLADGSEGPEMVWLPAGTFRMGSPAGDTLAFDDERPQHQVDIAQPFAIGRVPVTFADYDRFCAAAGRERLADQGWGRDRRPVINVSWEDAVAYCLWLTEQTGRVYRLPSEAEWEYACRAGTPTRWSFGDDAQALGDHAWFNGNSGGQTHPVGEKRPNPWGLRDMHGNVWEWVQDHGHDNYQGAPADGRAWQDASGVSRVLRGGCWLYSARDLRCACRNHDDPGSRDQDAGFRLVLGPQARPEKAGR